MPSEPLLAVGPPGSGRTGLLRRWAAAQAADGAELVLIDAGAGLAALVAWPATSTRLDLTEPSLVLRLFGRLSAEIDRRAGAPGPPIALAVDGLEPVAAVLDQLDFGSWTATLSKIADRGQECGIRLAVAGGPRARHHRCATSFRSVVLLGETPGDPGRARLGDSGPAVQVAIADDHVAPAPADRSDRLVIRPLPGRLRRDQLDEVVRDRGLPEPGCVPIGLGGDDAGPVGWELGATRALLVAGPPAAGVTAALLTLATGAARRGIPVLWLSGAAAEGQDKLPTGVAAVAGAAAVRRILVAHEGPLLLVCDRVGDVEDPAMLELLTRFCAAAGAHQTLAIGDRLDRALRSLRGPVPAVAGHRNGLLLSADGAGRPPARRRAAPSVGCMSTRSWSPVHGRHTAAGPGCFR